MQVLCDSGGRCTASRLIGRRNVHRCFLFRIFDWSFQTDRARANLTGLARGHQRCHYLLVIACADKAFDSLKRDLKLHGALVRAIRRHGIEGVCDRDDARLHRNLIAFQPLRIPSAVYHLMMHVHARQKFAHGGNLRHDLVALLRVLLHDLELFIRERCGLLQNIIVNANLADIV